MERSPAKNAYTYAPLPRCVWISFYDLKHNMHNIISPLIYDVSYVATCDHASILDGYGDMEVQRFWSRALTLWGLVTSSVTWALDSPTPTTLPYRTKPEVDRMTGCWDMVIWNSSRKGGLSLVGGWVGPEYSLHGFIIHCCHAAKLTLIMSRLRRVKKHVKSN